MKNRLALSVAFAVIAGICSAQNFSGLQNKKLVRADDAGFLLTTQISNLLGGKISGKIDSVVVTMDGEISLKVKIYYTDFINGYFTVSTLDDAKRNQNEISQAKFRQSTQPSPAECTLSLAPATAKGAKVRSPMLRIDVAKRENSVGSINVYALNKNWINQLEPQNVVINVNMTPVGQAASLTTQPIDVVPLRTIRFDPRVNYLNRSSGLQRPGGGNRVPVFDYSAIGPPDDISGTWLNTDANTHGITKLIVTNNNSIQGYGKCSPQDCDWGKVSLTDLGGNNFRSVFEWSFATSTLNISYSGTELTVNETNSRKGGSTMNNTYTFKKNISMVYARPNVYTLEQMAVLNAQPKDIKGLVKTDKAEPQGPQGPDNSHPINLINSFSADVDFKRPQDISNINLNAFPDKNWKTGIVYIFPADYHLKFEPNSIPEKGYDFRILYGKQSGGAAEGDAETTNAPVRMSATLTAGISSREMNFVRSLLAASLPGFVSVQYLPLRENPKFTFQSTLVSQYNIPQNKISVETTTDLTNDIKVSWSTDADTKEFIQTALTSREGIDASVMLSPKDEEIIDQLIPATINLADVRTLGKIYIEPTLWRTKNWRNQTPYPLQLNYLHVLKRDNSGRVPIIYSWSLDNTLIPSQAQVEFNSATVPTWLDIAPAVVMWVDYSIPDCSDCDRKVMDAVTGGVSGGKSQQIKFTIPPAVFDTLQASYFLISLRSRQVDPKGEIVKELDGIKLTKEAGEGSAGPLFIPTGGALDFEYKITVATADGDFFPANDWIKGSSKDVLLGKTKMKEIFKGIIPGIN